MIRVNNNKKKSKRKMLKANKSSVFIMTSILMCGAAGTAYAANTIHNSATAKGTYSNGTSQPPEVTSSASTADVDLPTKAPNMTLAVTLDQAPTIDGANGDDDFTDDGDTYRVKFVITNTGNTTLTDVSFGGNDGPVFDGYDGEKTLNAITYENGASLPTQLDIAPSGAVTLVRTIDLSLLDSRRAVGSSDGAEYETSVSSNEIATPFDDVLSVPINGFGKLQVVKSHVLNDAANGQSGVAELGETIDYTYVVTNIGNILIDDVRIVDIHQGVELTGNDKPANEVITTGATMGASTDAANNGMVDKLDAGSTATFTVNVAVKQSDIDNQGT